MPYAAAVEAGSRIVGGIGSWLAGYGDRKRREQDRARAAAFFKRLYGTMGQDVFGEGDQSRVYGMMERSMHPRWNKYAAGISKRLGMDSGVARGELAHRMMADQWGTRANLAMLSERLKASRDENILGQMSSYYGSLGRY